MTYKDWAEQHDVSPSLLSEVLNRQRRPAPSVLRAMGIRRKQQQYEEAGSKA
ncbi:MAG: hypothetical protein WCG26_00980 [Chloroflexales bacterium]